MDFDYNQPHKIVNGEPMLLSVAEIAERQVEEAVYAAQAPARAIAAIDAQMNAAESSKLLGRTAREDMVWRWVKDHVRDVMGKNPATLTGADDPLAVAALAAMTTPSDPHYNAGFSRLKAFDDSFVALRAQRTQLQQQLPPK